MLTWIIIQTLIINLLILLFVPHFQYSFSKHHENSCVKLEVVLFLRFLIFVLQFSFPTGFWSFILNASFHIKLMFSLCMEFLPCNCEDNLLWLFCLWFWIISRPIFFRYLSCSGRLPLLKQGYFDSCKQRCQHAHLSDLVQR